MRVTVAAGRGVRLAVGFLVGAGNGCFAGGRRVEESLFKLLVGAGLAVVGVMEPRGTLGMVTGTGAVWVVGLGVGGGVVLGLRLLRVSRLTSTNSLAARLGEIGTGGTFATGVVAVEGVVLGVGLGLLEGRFPVKWARLAGLLMT